MGRGPRAIGSALHQVATHFGVALVSNLSAFVLSLPLLVAVSIVSYAVRSFSLIPLGIALLVGVLPNPAVAGVQVIASELAHRDIVTMRDSWDGLREYWRLALRAWLVSLAGTVIILANVGFYSSQAGHTGSSFGTVAQILDLCWLFLLLLWLGVHLYVYPLLIEQEVKRVLIAYRNALVLEFTRPLFTFGVTLVWLLLLLVTSATGLGTVIGLTIGAAIQQNALVALLPTFRARA